MPWADASCDMVYRIAGRCLGGSVKAEGLGDGPAHAEVAIAKLRLTLPPKAKRLGVRLV